MILRREAEAFQADSPAAEAADFPAAEAAVFPVGSAAHPVIRAAADMVRSRAAAAPDVEDNIGRTEYCAPFVF